MVMPGAGTPAAVAGAPPRPAVTAAAGAATTLAVLVLLYASDHPWMLRKDNAGVFLGATTQAFRAWVHGVVPHWSDAFWGGYPLIADSTTAALYLPHLLPFALAGSPPLRLFDIALALHLGLLVAGSVRLLGILGVGTSGMVLGGIFALLCPFAHWIGMIAFPVVAAYAWWPWAFAAAEELARPGTPGTWRPLVQGWVALTAQVLVGVPELAAYGATVAALWLLTRRTGLPLRARACRLVLLGVGAAALAAPQLLPTALYVPTTTRSGDAALAGVVALVLTTPRALLVPGAGIMNQIPSFFGLVSLVLATVGATSRRPAALFLGATALVGFLLALGSQLPVYDVLHRVPPFNRFRTPLKFQALAEFAVAWLAAVGVDTLWRSGRRALRVTGLVLAIGALGERAAYARQELAFFAVLPPVERDNVAVLRMLSTSTTLRRRGPGGVPDLVLDVSGRDPALHEDDLIDTYARNLTAVADVSSVTGGIVALLSRRHAALLVSRPQSPASLDLLGIRLVLVRRRDCAATATRLGFHIIEELDAVCVLENPHQPPRYELLGPVKPVTTEEMMIDAARRDPGGPVPVVAAATALPAPAVPPGSIAVRAYAPGSIDLSTTTPEPALLLVRHSWVPGWEARIDGLRAEVHEAAGIYFAVPVPAGTHEVTLRYRTPGFGVGLGIAGAWIAATIVVAGRRRRRAVSG